MSNKSKQKFLWDFKIPLPPTYHFIALCFGLCGSSAFIKFLRACRVHVCDVSLKRSARGYYLEHFKFLQNCAGYKALTYVEHWQLTQKARAEFFSRVSVNVPVLFLVRDPISMLKTAANHPSSGGANRVFELGKNFEHILNIKKYYSNGFSSNALPNAKILSNTPNINSLERWINEIVFCWDFFATLLKKHEIIYIDMNEILPQNAFATLSKLSHQLSFAPPNEQDTIFTGQINGKLITYFPLFLELPLKNKTNKTVKITISTHQIHPNLKNNCQVLFDDHLPFKNMLVSMNDDDLKHLCQDDKLLKQTKAYLNEFLQALKDRIENEQEKLYKEEDVLNYLKQHKSLQNRLYTLLDKNLRIIFQKRPDLVDEWKYCKEFMNFSK